MKIECTLLSGNKDLIISIIGRFNHHQMMDFQETYAEKMDVNYIIDLKSTKSIDTSALGMLFCMRKTLGDNANITIVNSNQDIKRFFKLSRFDKKFNIE
ncbi:hypothetical protein A9Q81_06310 [Gammaproteobacteria bacterium 42_54_T18]|nr:hypothetical protein A9Q81_06310 [Gammaproteobacteria bacterium 42_54_T18]